MTDPVLRLAEAEAQAALARANLSHSAHALQARLNPRALANSAKREMADAGQAAAKAGMDGARRNPVLLAGLTALAGLFLARHRIAALVRRPKRGETRDAPAS